MICAAMASKLCGFTATSRLGAELGAELHIHQRRKGWISVSVAHGALAPPRLVRCSMATVGGMPKMASTSGRLAGCTNWRA